MFLSLAIILVFSILTMLIFKKLNIPVIISYLLVGILFGPHFFNLIDSSILNISSEIRAIALIIILIKAGLTLNVKDLKESKSSVIMLSFMPALFEIIAYSILIPLFFGNSFIEGALVGSVLAAVSPAVVVPKMVKLIEENRGCEKKNSTNDISRIIF